MPKVTVIEGENDLASQEPKVASQWHPEKNGITTANQVFVRSSQVAWWLCDLGHEWQAKVITRHVSGCPYCTNRKVLAGYNDLATTYPSVAGDWDFKRNRDLSPSEITAGTSKSVWWVCEEGHEWKTSPANRCGLGTGCPFCSGRRRVEGQNDLTTTHPEIAEEWNFARNIGIDPSKISASSGKKVWWLCSNGHEFQRVVQVRALQGLNDCPFCKSRKVWKGLNDLETTHPDLAKQWHPSKNKPLEPSQVSPKNNRQQLWWRCAQGHEWQAVARNRSFGGTGCPFCTNRKVIPGQNDLASLHPDLLQEWNPERNNPLSPDQLSIGSGKKVWWRCKLGHEWKASVGGRVQRKSGCPYCAGVLLLEGFNDLATTNPQLASEWHYERNYPLEPKEVSGGNPNKAWWRCTEGHEWEASISSRNSGIGCPSCATYGFNPEEPAVLYYLRNRALRASKVGITAEAGTRLEKFQLHGWQVVRIWKGNGQIIASVEKDFFRWLRKDMGIPNFLGREDTKGTGGWSETFEDGLLGDLDVFHKIEQSLSLHDAG